MSLNNALLQQAANTEGLKNHNEVTAAGVSMAETGKAPARFIGYVEMGNQPQPDYQGQKKQPAREVKLTFEVFGAKNTNDVEIENEDGSKTKKKRGALLTVSITEKQNEKAKFKKLFDRMKAGRADVNHFCQMLNEVFYLEVFHGEGKQSKKKYAHIRREDGSFAVEGPTLEVPNPSNPEETITIDMNKTTPQPSYDLRLFLVDKPSIEQWNSIKIEGTTKRKNKETGAEEEVSKNYLQEMIKRSLDWNGSAMQAILLDVAPEEAEATEAAVEGEEVVEDAVEEVNGEAVSSEEIEAIPEEPKAPAKKPTTTKPAAKSAAAKPSTTQEKKATSTPAKSAAKETNTDDLIASLGLV